MSFSVLFSEVALKFSTLEIIFKETYNNIHFSIMVTPLFLSLFLLPKTLTKILEKSSIEYSQLASVLSLKIVSLNKLEFDCVATFNFDFA